MGDRLLASKSIHYFTKPPRPTQPPTLIGTGNEYQPKCDDAVWLRSEGRCGYSVFGCMFRWQLKLCDPLLTRAIPEHRTDKQLVIMHYRNKASFTCTFKGKGKEWYLYSAFLHQGTHKALRHGSHSCTCKQHHAYLSFVSVHQMSPPQQLRQQTSNYYSFIDPERTKG